MSETQSDGGTRQAGCDTRSEQLPLSLSEPPRSPTRPQGKKALGMLEAAKGRGVSGVEFVNAYLFAYSQECRRLKQRGYDIVSRPDGDSKVHRYWLSEYAPKDEAA